jgi:hypothetical protein
MGGHYGDFRNWEEIDAWAADIAHHLERHRQKEEPPPAECEVLPPAVVWLSLGQRLDDDVWVGCRKADQVSRVPGED